MQSKIPQLYWDLDTLIIEPVFNDDIYIVPSHLKQRNYSVALLKYWFVYHFLLAENSNHRPLHICEIGNPQGQQLEFINKAIKRGYPEVCFFKWDVLGEDFQKPSFQMKRSDSCTEISRQNEKKSSKKGNANESANESSLLDLSDDYDVIICSGKFSGERNPEDWMSGLLGYLKENGILIGITGASRDVRSKKNTDSDFTLKTIYSIAKKNKLSIDFLSGGFFRRSNGLISQRNKCWFRFNLLLGALLPSLACELYWVYRK